MSAALIPLFASCCSSHAVSRHSFLAFSCINGEAGRLWGVVRMLEPTGPDDWETAGKARDDTGMTVWVVVEDCASPGEDARDGIATSDDERERAEG